MGSSGSDSFSGPSFFTASTPEAVRVSEESPPPLHEAVKQNQPGITQKLLSFGAEPMQLDSRGKIAFEYAQAGTHDAVIKVRKSMG